MDMNGLKADDEVSTRKKRSMFRLHCTTIDRDVITSLSSVREMINTSRGPVSYVDCTCGATVILEAGSQVWHGPSRSVTQVA